MYFSNNMLPYSRLAEFEVRTIVDVTYPLYFILSYQRDVESTNLQYTGMISTVSWWWPRPHHPSHFPEYYSKLTMVKTALPPVHQGAPLRRRRRFPILKRVVLVAAMLVTAHSINTWLFSSINETNDFNEVEATPKFDFDLVKESYVSEGTCEWAYIAKGALLS